MRSQVNRFGRFDTRPHVAGALAGLLGRIDGRVIDLGAGSGVLAAAVACTSPQADIVTVDVDPAANPSFRSTGHVHLTIDATMPCLPDHLPGGPASFDAGVSNPPFSAFGDGDAAFAILAAAGLGDVGPIGLESLFVAQMLRLVKPGGRVGLVASAAFVSGLANEGFRKALLRRCRIVSVVELPRGSFVGADAVGHLVLMSMDGPTRIMNLSRLGDAFDCTIAAADARRWDRRFHASSYRDGPSLRELGAEVTRGTLCPGLAKRDKVACIHITTLSGGSGPLVLPRMNANDAGAAGCTASSGDIMIARVGRNLSRSVRSVASGAQPFTDCVFRLRVPQAQHSRVLAFLTSEAGRLLLDSTARGTGARHLLRDDLLDMRVPDDFQTASAMGRSE